MKNKILNRTLNLVALIAAGFVFSCAKSPSGVRSTKKTSSQTLNQAVSNASIQAASAASLLYRLTMIQQDPTRMSDNSFRVESEIKTPTGKYYPITTSHIGNQDSIGTFNDPDSGTSIDVRARCVGSMCEKYVMLITVVKNGFAVHQMAAISWNTDCAFHLEDRNASITSNFYRNLNEVENQNANLGAVNDCPAQ